MKRHRLSQSEAKEWIALRDQEGLIWKKLSELSGIPASTLAWWGKRKLSERPRKDGFATIVTQDIGYPDGESRALARIRLRSGHEIELPYLALDDMIRSVVALGSC